MAVQSVKKKGGEGDQSKQRKGKNKPAFAVRQAQGKNKMST